VTTGSRLLAWWPFYVNIQRIKPSRQAEPQRPLDLLLPDVAHVVGEGLRCRDSVRRRRPAAQASAQTARKSWGGGGSAPGDIVSGIRPALR